jgi:tetratricopeptide (TPR) repeat protein
MMKLADKINFTEIAQRRFVILNAFISFCILGIICAYTSIGLNYYFPYKPVLSTVVFYAITGLFAGNVVGRALFRNAGYRKIYIASEAFFVLFSIIYFFNNFMPLADNESILACIVRYDDYPLAILSVIPFFAGIKYNYFLKVSCGNFIDDRFGTIPFLFSAFSGAALGIFTAFAFYYYINYFWSLGFLTVPLIISIFIVKLPYASAPGYEQDNGGGDEVKPDAGREDLFFTYLNFSFVMIYSYMGYLTVIKHLGAFLHVQLAFLALLLVSLSAGFVIARFAKNAFWYIYTEMLFPIGFLTFLVLIYYAGSMPFFALILYFIPVSVISGFSLYHTIMNIMVRCDHAKRFNIIDFSFIILPVPIIISLSFIDFTSLWFFILLYVIMLMNVIIPGIHLMQRKVSGYKKMLYFAASLIFIPLVILIHMYFNIPLESKLYITHSDGFGQISGINYNAPFIKGSATVYLNRLKAFNASDGSIRSIKRSLIPLFLYHDYESGKNRFLFIDGNQKFYQNQVMGFFKNARYIDYLPDRLVDNNILPVSGRQTYVPESSEILEYMLRGQAPYDVIADIPNIYDQSVNSFRFSREYYGIIRSSMQRDGIFLQVFDLINCRGDFIRYASHNLKESFSRSVGFLFSNLLVVLNTNSVDALNITGKNIANLSKFFKSRSDITYLFHNEKHLLSCCLFTDITKFAGYSESFKFYEVDAFQKKTGLPVEKPLLERYSANSALISDLIDKSSDKYNLRRQIGDDISRDSKILTLLKKTEISEIMGEYEEEAGNLMDLKKYGEYRPDLRNYIAAILSFKEDSYYYRAIEYEKDKKWDKARSLYAAILTINKDNFDANYRMGILCITLQNINESLVYIQNAMRLKKDDPKVQYQMGMLLFSSGKPKEALEYLQRAIQLKENSASVYLYLGLCYEELGNILEAKKNYEAALLKDPNDANTQMSLERVKGKIEDEKNKWKTQSLKNDDEVEKGEKIPLPISKAVYKNRLTDNEINKAEKTDKK